MQMKLKLLVSGLRLYWTLAMSSLTNTPRARTEVCLFCVLNHAQTKTQPTFKLKNASFCGVEILISDPNKWQELEDEHLKANLQLTKRTK